MAAAREKISRLSPVLKNKRGQVVHQNQKVIIINVYKKLKETNPQISYEDTIATLSEQTGIGRNSIKNIIAEYNRTGQVSEPNLKKRRLSFNEKVDDYDKDAIKEIVENFYRNNDSPTLDKVLQAVNDEEDLPKFKRSTFHKLLRELNITFPKRQRK